MYSAITTPVPIANDKGKFRLGFFTSPAVNVTLFHASDENSDPTCATATTTITPNSPLKPKEGNTALEPALRQKFPKFSAIACGLRATVNPSSTSPSRAAVFAIV